MSRRLTAIEVNGRFTARRRRPPSENGRAKRPPASSSPLKGSRFTTNRRVLAGGRQSMGASSIG